MPIQILMPALSPTMTEGKLVKWHKQKGDTIQSGDVLAEIETDKAIMEVDAVDEGTLGEIIVPNGTENVKVNAPIALLLEEGEDPASLLTFEGERPQTSSPVPPSTPHTTAVPVSPASSLSLSMSQAPSQAISAATSKEQRVFASPLARRIASQKNIALKTMKGSGPHGRIIKRDVEPMSSSPSIAPSIAKLPSQVQEELGFSGFEPPYKEQPLSMMRKVIARRLTESKRFIPHFYLSVDCEIDQLLAARGVLNAENNLKISVNDIVIRACALTLQKVPETNVAWAGDTIRFYERADISVAVAVDGGLITPIIRGAESKGLNSISEEMKDLAARARAGKLRPDAFQGGTFCLSNLGMYGVKSFSAIINPPQAGILAIGAGAQKPIVKNGEVSIATLMNTTLSVDHRAIDGAVAAHFLHVFKELIENPLKMLL